jgi:hypothetical protein
MKPIVTVEWIDASMDNPHWNDGDLPPVPAKGDNNMFTCGYLAHQTDDWVVVIQTLGKGVHANSVEIPVRMIVSMKTIRK